MAARALGNPILGLKWGQKSGIMWLAFGLRVCGRGDFACSSPPDSPLLVTPVDPSLSALRRCAAGHADGLAELFERHGTQVYRLCFHLLNSPAEAEDATQDVFLRILDKAGGFQGKSQVKTWIHRITMNHCLNLLDKRKRAPQALLDGDLAPAPAAAAATAPLEQNELAHQVRDLIARLPEDGRAVFVLREVEGLSYREIAETLELAPGTVMSRLARARERFRQLAGPAARDLGLLHDDD